MKTLIKEIRAAKRISQETLAKSAGISRTYLSRIEACESIPSVAVAQSIAKALGSTVDAIFFYN